jgi:Tol biopolymer transport system component
VERAAIDEQRCGRERAEDQQRVSARALRRPGFRRRGPLDHRPRVYQAARAGLALLALAGCGEPGPRFGEGASDGLVMVRVVGASNEIVRVRLADAASQLLTGTRDQRETWPYWSPTAQRLVFQVSNGEQRHDLRVFDPQTGSASALTSTPARDEQWPAWSPVRPELAFAFRGGSPPGGLALADLAGGAPRVLAASGARDLFYRPSFAPDGAWLVAQRRHANGRGSGLWRVAADREPQALTGDPEWFDMKPAVTRDGREVVFSRRPAAGGPRDVLAIPAQGGPLRTLAAGAQSDDHSGSPSPQRDELVFVSDRDGPSAIYLAPLAGGEARALLLDSERAFFAPRWSPDGERLAAIATPRALGEPRLSDRASLEATRVVVLDRSGRVLLDAPGFMPDWMPPWR